MVAEIQNSEKIKENNKMNYTVLNEELRIYACHVGDLTGKEAGKFLEKFPDSPLSSMTIYYKSEDDIILINQDNPYYDKTLNLIMLYLTGTEQEIDDYMYDIVKKRPAAAEEVGQDLWRIRCIRETKKCVEKGFNLCRELDIGLNIGEMEQLYKGEGDTFSMLCNAYYMGVARGYEATM